MTITRYEKLLQRFRHMMVDSGVCPQDISNAELLEMVKGDSHEKRMEAMDKMTSIVPKNYWERRGL